LPLGIGGMEVGIPKYIPFSTRRHARVNSSETFLAQPPCPEALLHALTITYLDFLRIHDFNALIVPDYIYSLYIVSPDLFFYIRFLIIVFMPSSLPTSKACEIFKYHFSL
jgi:hypothetical protein